MKTKSLLLALLATAFLMGASLGNQPTERATEAKNKNTPSAPVSAFVNKANPNPTADHREAEAYNYYGNFNFIPPTTAAPRAENFWVGNRDAIAGLSAIFVAAFTGALVWVSRKQWRAIKEQADIANKTLTETAKAADAAKKSADAATGALLALARPKLVVRYVRKSVCEPDKPIEVLYTVVNVGGWPAYVLESNFAIVDQNDLPPMPPYKDGGTLGKARIPSGDWKTGRSVSREILSKDRFRLLYEDWNVFFFGYILYTDEGDGTRRYTVVCRRWSPMQETQGAFIPVDSEDHENAD